MKIRMPGLFVQCALVLALVEPAALAQMPLRVLPAEAKKGEMQPPGRSEVRIDGKAYGIAPGIRIRDMNNMIVFAANVTQPATVRYTLDPMGLVDKVWILTAEEKALPDPKPPVFAPPR